MEQKQLQRLADSLFQQSNSLQVNVADALDEKAFSESDLFCFTTQRMLQTMEDAQHGRKEVGGPMKH